MLNLLPRVRCADYALVTSSRYVNIQVGIKDRRVFDVPTQCRRANGA